MKIEAITIGEILAVLVFIGAFIKAVEYLANRFTKCADNWLNKAIEPLYTALDKAIEPITLKLEELDKRMTNEEIETMRPELMRMLSLVDRGQKLSEFERKHLDELKRKYNNKGGDSYIDDYYDRLRKERKL